MRCMMQVIQDKYFIYNNGEYSKGKVTHTTLNHDEKQQRIEQNGVLIHRELN